MIEIISHQKPIESPLPKNMFLKTSKAHWLIQVPPVTQTFIEMAGSEYTEKMYIIETLDEIPNELPETILDQIELHLKEYGINDTDDVAILSPYIPAYHGFFLEIFDWNEADKYITYIKEHSNTKIIGKGFESNDSIIDVPLV